MEVILKQDVDNLGLRGEVVKVADGYARNYLLPKKMAMQATAADKTVAEELAAKLAPIELSFTRKSGEEGHLFGSVTAGDIATEIAAKGFEIDRHKIVLPEPLKTVGETTVGIKLHREVIVQIKVQIIAEASEETAAAAEATEAPAAEAPVAEAPAAE
jgi:large subunit ribosomal protein L9